MQIYNNQLSIRTLFSKFEDTIKNNGQPHFDNDTKKFYGSCASLYDYLYPDHLEYSKKLFNDLAPLLKKEKVVKILDASCGIGYDISCLLQHGFEVDGSDISPEMISEAKNRLGSKYIGKLILADVRKISSIIQSDLYDCVIFRGNTFSNIRPTEIPLVINELSSVLKKNGILCFDFRDSTEQIKKQGMFELRGCGFNRETKKFYLSYYKLTHSKNINEPYIVHAHIWYGLNSSFRHFVRHCTLNIRSHYVDTNNVISTIKPIYKDIQSINLDKEGLPFLSTYIGRKL